MWCPRCEQGVVVPAKIKKTGETIYICEECEAVWSTENIKKETFKDFRSFMKEKGLQALGAEIEFERNSSSKGGEGK